MKTRIFKTREFDRWAIKEGLPDSTLITTITEMDAGLVDANLGGFVYKKRVPLHSRGKRSGARTLVAFKTEDKAFFIYGFAKNQRSNVLPIELKALKLLASQLLSYAEKELTIAINKKELIEIYKHE